MSKKSSIFAVFSVLTGVLLFAIWSNIHASAQQQSSSLPPQSRSADSLNTTKISPELKANMCDPNNPSLKVVNATESRICGIPRTVKPRISSLTTTATPQTSMPSSTPKQTTTATTKPALLASVSTNPPKQQQITNTRNNNIISGTIGPKIGSAIAPAINSSNSSLSSSSSSPSPIAPQIKAVNQPQRQDQTPITRASGTTAAVNATAARQNYTFTSTTPPLGTSGKIMYLDHHGDKGNPSNHYSSSTDKTGDSANPKSPSHSTRSTTAADNGVSTGKKNKNIDTTKIDTNSTTNSESASELASSIKKKVESMVRNSISGIINKTPFLLPFH